MMSIDSFRIRSLNDQSNTERTSIEDANSLCQQLAIPRQDDGSSYVGKSLLFLSRLSHFCYHINWSPGYSTAQGQISIHSG